jgi:excisionase family DNA binding protein
MTDTSLPAMPATTSAKPAKSIAQFAKDWGFGRPKIYELIAAKQLRAVKIGKATRILASDEVAFAAALPELQLHPRSAGGAHGGRLA